jgi:RNA polymerase sigma-70 factor (ECF subfamily)
MQRNGATDNDWIEQALADHQGPLIRYATNLLDDRERARDVVQDTFLRLCRQPPQKVNRGLKTWLFITCRRRALDVLKKEKRMSRIDDVSAQPQPSNAPDPRGQIESEETQQVMLEQLAALPDQQREVIRLKFAGGLSYKQIAEVTGLKNGYVGYLIHHGLKNLRRPLSEHGAS